jgi:hypothetical protein
VVVREARFQAWGRRRRGEGGVKVAGWRGRWWFGLNVELMMFSCFCLKKENLRLRKNLSVGKFVGNSLVVEPSLRLCKAVCN